MMRPRFSGRRHEAGIVTVLAAIVLIVVVLLWLRQSLDITGGSSLQDERQKDSTAALFLAESGLQRGIGYLYLNRGALKNTTCTGLATNPITKYYPTGSAENMFWISAASVDNSGCDSETDTVCQYCDLTVTGMADASSRTIKSRIGISTVDGVSCNSAIPGVDCSNQTTPRVWELVLTNSYSTWALGLFHLADIRKGQSDRADCMAPDCLLNWTVSSLPGKGSIGSQENAVPIAPSASKTIYQVLDASAASARNRNVAEVGAFLRGSLDLDKARCPAYSGLTAIPSTVPGLPCVTGAYWNSKVSGGPGVKTVANSGTLTGEVTNGAAQSTFDCAAPIVPEPNPGAQTVTTASGNPPPCKSWCYGGERIIYGFAAAASSLADSLSAVTFNTGGTPAQGIPLTKLAKFPTPDAPNTPTDVYSEIWVSDYNPVYRYGAAITARIDQNAVNVSGASTLKQVVSDATGKTCEIRVSYPVIDDVKIHDEVIKSGITSPARITGVVQGTGGVISGSICSNQPSSEYCIQLDNECPTLTVGGTPPSRINNGDIKRTQLKVTGIDTTWDPNTLPIYYAEGYLGPALDNALARGAQALSSKATTAIPVGTKILRYAGNVAGGCSVTNPIDHGIGCYDLAYPRFVGFTSLSSNPNTTFAMIAGAWSQMVSGVTTVYTPGITTPRYMGDGVTPALTKPMMINVRKGTGVLATQSRVVQLTSGPAPTATQFTVGANSATPLTPTTQLNGAQLCGGACAYFNHADVNDNPANAVTNFSITASAGTGDWASGFSCVFNADIDPKKIRSATLKPAGWTEIVR